MLKCSRLQKGTNAWVNIKSVQFTITKYIYKQKLNYGIISVKLQGKGQPDSEAFRWKVNLSF